jgi:hypothetical protein
LLISRSVRVSNANVRESAIGRTPLYGALNRERFMILAVAVALLLLYRLSTGG